MSVEKKSLKYFKLNTDHLREKGKKNIKLIPAIRHNQDCDC